MSLKCKRGDVFVPQPAVQSSANRGGATHLELEAESLDRTGLQASLGVGACSPFA
jgi:hypothetical protein